MRVIVLFFLFCCGVASAQPLQVGLRSMAWNPRFAEFGAVTSAWANGAIKMPYVQSDKAGVAARINEALYLRHMGMPAPLTAGKTFALADGAEVPASTASQEVTILRNDGRILSFQIDREGCGAYCENYAETVSFDARTGRVITLEDVLNAHGRAEIPKRMLEERIRQYRAQIKQLQQQLKALRTKGKAVAADTVDDLESRVSLNETCLEEAQQKQVSKAWDLVDFLRFELPAEKGMVFTSGRCSNHASRALDDVGDVSLTVAAQALDKMLTPYGQSLILDAPSVQEPTTVFHQVLHGKIGAIAITALLTSSSYGAGEPSISGIYAYNKYRKPIALSGKQVGQTLSLQEAGDDKARASMTLQLGQTGLSGQWEGNHKKLPMTLLVGK
ncbi:MAG: hypothetical protein FD135_4651 [Comamonadaceae bacterium]|nr:MAG: hypothetical protein FD135_4651 [Comamonadaceae bacterium]